MTTTTSWIWKGWRPCIGREDLTSSRSCEWTAWCWTGLRLSPAPWRRLNRSHVSAHLCDVITWAGINVLSCYYVNGFCDQTARQGVHAWDIANKCQIPRTSLFRDRLFLRSELAGVGHFFHLNKHTNIPGWNMLFLFSCIRLCLKWRIPRSHYCMIGTIRRKYGPTCSIRVQHVGTISTYFYSCYNRCSDLRRGKNTCLESKITLLKFPSYIVQCSRCCICDKSMCPALSKQTPY